MKTPGPQKPRREPDELGNVGRSRYFFLAAFFLAAGFLAAFFFAAMMVYLLGVNFGPDEWFRCGGSACILRKVCRLALGGRLCDGNHEQHRFTQGCDTRTGPLLSMGFA
jgi:hypothetical protein